MEIGFVGLTSIFVFMLHRSKKEYFSFVKSYHYIAKAEERQAINRQLKMTPVSKSIGTLIHRAFQKEKCRQNRAEEHGSLTRQLTGEGRMDQELRGVVFNKVFPNNFQV